MCNVCCNDCKYSCTGACIIYSDDTCRRDRENEEISKHNFTSTNAFNSEVKKKTNYEKVKQLSLDDLALMICNTHISCEECKFRWECNDNEPNGSGIKHWLESDVSTFGGFSLIEGE